MFKDTAKVDTLQWGENNNLKGSVLVILGMLTSFIKEVKSLSCIRRAAGLLEILWLGLKIDYLCVGCMQEAVIEPGTTAYDNWVSTGGAVYRQFWLFDVKNPLEVLQHGSKPVVIEKGPYTYR